jgi:hypothetical protein
MKTRPKKRWENKVVWALEHPTGFALMIQHCAVLLLLRGPKGRKAPGSREAKEQNSVALANKYTAT